MDSPKDFSIDSFNTLVQKANRFSITSSCFITDANRLSMVVLFLHQGLEGYFLDSGFDQNTVRESGKR